ncbi:flagellar hook-associated protein 1 FlgK [Austwickia chelonae]|uniref:Flagellar hook-associated protein 1 n=1 Tax=Austwickia chelonae NBRC 105200 TaxID=1184607 RepID=K6VB42_9MICO|nr:flagellar hook-associated protein FlgK [Austwickia chelonae]GAB79463.1 flagellar hook-associated protein 1 [Austwickia chelonae NBRC 105200]SEV88287.1 flagellar hook-associated protein 1 FlgK [Austwickia chelonae]
MSSFSALNLGARAVFAAQRGLDTTGQNIANSATPGYSRQRVDQVAVGGPTVPAIWAKYDQAGGGVKVTGISRMRDEFLEARARNAHSALGQLGEQTKTYEAVERTIGEPSDIAFKKQLNEFWNSWANAAQGDLKSEAARNVVVSSGVTVANRLNSMASQLETQWADRRTELEANVTEVNKAAEDIAKLNRAIKNNVINGLPANELADQRDLLVEKVTTLTGGVAERAEDGVVNIKLGSNYLVSGNQSASLKVTGGAASYAAWDGTTKATVSWATDLDGQASTVTTPVLGADKLANPKSTMNGQLEALNETIPNYLTQLDKVAEKLASTVNEQNAQGYTVDTTPGGKRGTALFTTGSSTGDPAPTGRRAAINIRFAGTASDLGISASDIPPVKADGTPGVLNGDNAKAMFNNANKPGEADDQYRNLVVQLGVDAQSVYRNNTVAKNVAKTADDARDSVSGVSLNEEMTNLMKYQHSFSAAAKFITAIDTTIESLLNMKR